MKTSTYSFELCFRRPGIHFRELEFLLLVARVDNDRVIEQELVLGIEKVL